MCSALHSKWRITSIESQSTILFCVVFSGTSSFISIFSSLTIEKIRFILEGELNKCICNFPLSQQFTKYICVQNWIRQKKKHLHHKSKKIHKQINTNMECVSCSIEKLSIGLNYIFEVCIFIKKKKLSCGFIVLFASLNSACKDLWSKRKCLCTFNDLLIYRCNRCIHDNSIL